MNELSFYPMLTDEMIEACGFKCEKYSFTYVYQGQEFELTQSGKNTVKLSDSNEIWKIEDDGLCFEKRVKREHPHLLYGTRGIAPADAEIGMCIIWTNRTLTQTGHIMPQDDISTPTGRTCTFSYTFSPGEIKGDLELSLVLYLKKVAQSISQGEEHLMNESGVTLGEVETVSLDFNSIYMEFPIEECNAKDQPLWWVEFSQWEDPRVDLFSKENLCLYLNTAYDACPMAGENIKNIELLVSIISTVYFLVFKKLSDDDLHATKHDIGLSPNSICSIMHQFITGCSSNLQWESDESLLRTIQINVAAMLKEGEE